MHFMQPGSTTIPYAFTSACTSTFEVQAAVQCPHCSQASVTRMRPGATRSATAKKPPYGQAYVQKPFDPRKYTVMKPQMKRKGTATASGGKVAQKSLVTRWFVSAGTS